MCFGFGKQIHEVVSSHVRACIWSSGMSSLMAPWSLKGNKDGSSDCFVWYVRHETISTLPTNRGIPPTEGQGLESLAGMDVEVRQVQLRIVDRVKRLCISRWASFRYSTYDFRCLEASLKTCCISSCSKWDMRYAGTEKGSAFKKPAHTAALFSRLLRNHGSVHELCEQGSPAWISSEQRPAPQSDAFSASYSTNSEGGSSFLMCGSYFALWVIWSLQLSSANLRNISNMCWDSPLVVQGFGYLSYPAITWQRATMVLTVTILYVTNVAFSLVSLSSLNIVFYSWVSPHSHYCWNVAIQT